MTYSLENAHSKTISMLSGEYLSTEEVVGEDLIKLVNTLSNRLERIRTAIAKYGSDFLVPYADNEIPKNDIALFKGCGHW